MFNRGNKLAEMRTKIIMAALSGGQHIDAALEAADKLVPQSDIDAARDEDRRLADKWIDARMESMAGLAVNAPKKTRTSHPWYASISRWWPF